MNSIIQVFGAAGLIETVVQFTYALTNRENFTAFEEWYFLTSGCCEVAGEAVFLVAGLWLVARNPDPSKRGVGLSSLAKDPVHCMAGSSFEATSGKVNEANENYARLSFLGVLLSVLSFLAWASFWAVWGDDFDGDGDEGVRWALSICALALTIIFLACWLWRKDESYYMLGTVMIMYAAGKGFQVYILATDLERMSPSDLGASLIILQAIEILSMAIVLGSIVMKETGGGQMGAVGPRSLY